MPMDRTEVVIGARARVKNVYPTRHTTSFDINPHLMLSGQQTPLVSEEVLIVLSRPRRIDGINLVRVRRADGLEGEVYYCDIANRCSRTE